MKEVRAFVFYSSGTKEEAIEGLIIALAQMIRIRESELREIIADVREFDGDRE
jgi:hypothetical protein